MTEPSRRKKVLQGSLSNLLRLVLSLAFSLYLPHFLVHHMGPAEYSAWVLILQLAAYINYLEFGIQTAVSKFVAEYDARGDRNELHRTVSSAFLLLVAGGTIGLAAIAILSWKIPVIFRDMPVSLWSQVRFGLIAIGCSTAFSLPFSTFTAIFVGLQQYTYPTLVATFSRALSMAAIIVTLLATGNLLSMALVLALFNIVTALATYAGWFKLAAHRAPLRIAAATRAHLQRLFRYCGVLSVWTFGGLLISGLDTLIVGHFDFRNTGYYAVAASATNFVIMLLGSLVSPLMPATASFGVVSTADRMGALLLRASRYSNLLLFLIALPLFAGGYFLLRLWVGADYAQHAFVFLRILLLANVVRYLVYVYTVMVVAGGRQRSATLSPACEAVLNFGLSILLARHYGAIGVAWGTFAGALLGVVLHLLQSMRRTQDLLRFGRLQLVMSSIARPAIVLLPAAALLAANRLSPPSVPLAPLLSGLCIVVTAMVAWRFALNASERKEALRLTFMRMRRLTA
jgi:O-antigen/teichoic acid export membrane protein